MNPTFLSYPDLNDPRTQYVLCSMIQAFRLQPTADQALQIFRGQYAGPFTWQYLGLRENLYTGTLIIKWNDNVLWLSEGTSEVAHIPALVNGWTFFRGGADQLGASDAFWAAKNALGAAARPEFYMPRLHHFFAGHSFGGAQLHVLATFFGTLWPGSSPRGFSYGSPRPGGTLFQRNSIVTSWTRWFTEADPVPRVPPHVDEAPILHLGTGLVLTLGANQQVQAPTGRMIRADATVVEQEASPVALVMGDLSLLSWIASSNCMHAQDHRLSVYMDRFAAMQASNTQTIRSRVVQPVLEVPERLGHGWRNRLVVPAVRDFIAAQNPVNPIVPMPRVPVAPQTQPPAPAGTLYRVKRFEGIHYVTFAGYAYGIGPGKKAARRLAKTWNRAIRLGEAKPPVEWVPQPEAG